MRAVLRKNVAGWWWSVKDKDRVMAFSHGVYTTRRRCWNALRKILNVKRLEIETIGGK
jgi:hypothetical protein